MKEKMIKTLTPKELKELSVKNNFAFPVALIRDWLIILATVYFVWNNLNIFSYLIGIAIIATRMHALIGLMHEVAHFNFLKNKSLADLIINITVCWPLGFFIQGYRENHSNHHRYLNTEKDPDWRTINHWPEYQHPLSKRFFTWTIIKYLIGYNGARDIYVTVKRFFIVEKVKAHLKTAIIYYIVLFSLLTYFEFWPIYLLFWIVPVFTTFSLINYYRSYAEHFGPLKHDHPYNFTRGVLSPTWLEKALVSQNSLNYHLAHHLYPSIPYYNLKKLHAILMKDKKFVEKAHLTENYFTALRNEFLKS